ncbi:hypothetical protein ACU8MP_14620 [Rhizobium leguminosarum]
MFFDKHSRFIRRYLLTFRPRHDLGATLPLLKDDGALSIEEALEEAVAAGKAEIIQPNGDVVSLVKVGRGAEKSLVLLFHRDRPDAPDPTYRRYENGARKLRNGQKDDNEEQTYSAHLILMAEPLAANKYRSALEEIPGLSFSTIVQVIREVLTAFVYEYKDKRGEVQQTYTCVRYEGIKSANFEEALAKGVLNIKLSRRTDVTFLDAEGIIEPGRDTATLKIKADLDAPSLMEKLLFWKQKAADNGWHEFSVDIDAGHNRQRTIKLERTDEAKEVLFVRSEQITVDTTLAAAEVDIVPEMVTKCIELLKT